MWRKASHATGGSILLVPERTLAERRRERLAALRAAQTVRFADALVLATGDELDADVVLTADGRWRSASARVELLG